MRRLVADLRGHVSPAALDQDLAAVERQLNEPFFNGPRPIAHGWYATAYDGAVYEVYVFGDGRGLFVAVDASSGRIVMQGQGEPAGWLKPSRAAAIEAVLETAVDELTRARAAVDQLRAELAATPVNE